MRRTPAHGALPTATRLCSFSIREWLAPPKTLSMVWLSLLDTNTCCLRGLIGGHQELSSLAPTNTTLRPVGAVPDPTFNNLPWYRTWVRRQVRNQPGRMLLSLPDEDLKDG